MKRIWYALCALVLIMGTLAAVSSVHPGGTRAQAATDSQPDPTVPIRAAFYYPWFGGPHGAGWNQQGFDPFTNYHPIYGNYDITASQVQTQIQEMQYANIQVGIASWWGQGSFTDQKFPTLFQAAAGTSFRWAPYYETEGNGSNPSASAIAGDLNYLKTNYATDPSFLRINGKYVIFVYGEAGDACTGPSDYAQRWQAANQQTGNQWYVVLKVFSGYQTCTAQPQSWHQYGPATESDTQGNYSTTISPGFWKPGDTGANPVGAPRLTRDVGRWRNAVIAMANANTQWHLITTFNEWGEGTAVEPATEFSSDSGNGQFLDILHRYRDAGTTSPTTAARHVAPGIPTNVSATVVDQNHAQVTWTAPADNGGDPITQYDVVSTPGSHTATVTGSPPATTATVAQLSPTAPNGYTFTVTATNANGTSGPSAASNVVNTGTVSTATVPDPPTNVQVLSGDVGNGQARVTLFCPANDGGSPLLDFTVTANPGGQTGVVAPPCSPIGSVAATVTGLTNGTSYTFTARARNAIGYSVPSAPSPAVVPTGTTTTPGAPGGVTASAGSNQATISWTAPSNGGSAITSYTVTPFVGTTAQSGLVKTVTGNPAPTSTTITGLTNGTAYTFQVHATNAVGSGPDSTSNSVTPTASATAPGTPTGVTASIVSGTTNSISVSWATPASNGGSAITGYVVKQDDGSLTNVGVVNSTTLANVTAGTRSYQVAAKNQIGQSAFSNTSNTVTIQSPPGGALAVSSTTPCNAAHNPTAPTGYKHIIVFMMENHVFPGGTGFNGIPIDFTPGVDGSSPYWNSVQASCTSFTNLLDTDQPATSLDEYIGLTTGHFLHFNDNDPSSSVSWTGDNIFRQVRNAGLSVLNFVEGSNGSCTNGSSAVRHTPSLYMWGAGDGGKGGAASPTVCANETKTLTQSGADILINAAKNGTLPNFSIVTPTDTHDAHGGCITCADNFFKQYAVPIFDGPNYQSGDTLVIMEFDENRPTPNIFFSPYIKPGNVTTQYSQYGMLQDFSRMLNAGNGKSMGIVATDGHDPAPSMQGNTSVNMFR